jgi:hypothetical protein
MEFYLIYAGGLLKSAGNKNRRTWEKHAIRRDLHSQMKRLWETHPASRYYADKTVEERGQRPRRFLDAMAHNFERSGVGFIPLITAANGLACSLDILFLRPDRPGTILQGGRDIDNRMKLLIDALRIPSGGSEMQKREGDEPDANPMYCLLEDDNLITSLKVKTDRLLFTMGEGQNEACLVIRVETANVDPFGSPWELHL